MHEHKEQTEQRKDAEETHTAGSSSQNKGNVEEQWKSVDVVAWRKGHTIKHFPKQKQKKKRKEKKRTTPKKVDGILYSRIIQGRKILKIEQGTKRVYDGYQCYSLHYPASLSEGSLSVVDGITKTRSRTRYCHYRVTFHGKVQRDDGPISENSGSQMEHARGW
jgi:hypothetical protein